MLQKMTSEGMKQEQSGENKPKRDERGRLLPGYTANPKGGGRKKETKVQKEMRKANKEIIKDYIDKLTEALPKISPALLEKAKGGDLTAIKEVHDRVMGKAKETKDINLKTLNINQLLDDLNSDKFPEIEG